MCQAVHSKFSKIDVPASLYAGSLRLSDSSTNSGSSACLCDLDGHGETKHSAHYRLLVKVVGI